MRRITLYCKFAFKSKMKAMYKEVKTVQELVLYSKVYKTLSKTTKSDIIRQIVDILNLNSTTVTRHLNIPRTIPNGFGNLRSKIYSEIIIRNMRVYLEQNNNELIQKIISEYDNQISHDDSCKICGAQASYNKITGMSLCDEHFAKSIKQILS